MVSGAILGHVSVYPEKHDRNEDGFADMPKGTLITFASKWDYHNNNSGLEGQLNVQWLSDYKEGGHADHLSGETDHYNVSLDMYFPKSVIHLLDRNGVLQSMINLHSWGIIITRDLRPHCMGTGCINRFFQTHDINM
jgi:hypothetical protein